MRFKTKNIKFSPIKEIQQEAEELGAVSLAQGIPKFLPPLAVRRAAAQAVEQGLADFYGHPRGLPALRKKISERHLSEERVFYDPESEVLVTAGALQGLSAALATLLSPGDELIVLTPSYFPFLNLPPVLGIKPVYTPLKTSGWTLDADSLKRAISSKTRGILICHPNNPTGTVYSKKDLEEIMTVARKNDLWVFVDEVYRYFTYGTPYTSMASFEQDKNRVIRIMSFSKAFSLSGWRVGYVLSESPVVNEISKVHEMMVTASASLPAQYAALSALEDAGDLPHRFGEILKARGRRMEKRLERLGEFFEFSHPKGTYYFFVKLKKERDDVSFAQEILKDAGVAVVPGSTFGEVGRGYLRLSFAAKEGEIDEAFDRLERHLLGKSKLHKDLKELAKVSSGVTEDSRLVEKDNIFVAVSGANHDGHDFVEEALEKEASFVVGEQDLKLPNYTKVDDSRLALGHLSAAYFDNPSKKLKVIGVTGTDGKTTTSHLLGDILNKAGIKTKVASTINVSGVHTTTPPAPILQKLLAEALEEGAQAAVVEVTSHAISQKRIAGTDFAAAVLTNVTPEHLDYHETFERYRDTKALLFADAPLSVLNFSDSSFDIFKDISSGKVVAYGRDVTAQDIKVEDLVSRFKLVRGSGSTNISLPLPGEYNISNALAAAACAMELFDISAEDVKKALEGFNSEDLIGRFDRVEGISGPTAIVDFAHTPNALLEVLNYVARFKPTGSKLIVVFGAAGERDRIKRPKMGEVAAKTADFVVLTAEDPRSENPEKIIDEIAQGCFAQGAIEGKNFVRVPDRRKAISTGLKKAGKDDIVLVLGKGHERTMAISGVEHPWSDHQVVKEEFAKISR